MIKPNNTFCPVPWKELSATPSGSVRLCCSSLQDANISKYEDGSVAKLTDDLQLAWNTNFFQEVRKKMLANEHVRACENCYRQDNAGIKSAKTAWLEKYPDLSNEDLASTIKIDQVELLDLRLGNICNLRCRMCDPYSSSAWMKEWRDLGELVPQPDDKTWSRLEKNEWPQDPRVWEQLKRVVPKLRTVRLTGGEPFLVTANKEFLKYCIQSGHASHIELNYSTNGTVWDNDLPELWKHFEQVNLRVSVDGLYEVNDYIRTPSRFEQILRNIDKMQELASHAPVKVIIGCTVQIYNIFQIPSFIEFFRNKNLFINLDFVQDPSYLALNVLPKNLAEKAQQILQKEIAYPGVSALVNLLDSSKTSQWNQFIAYTKKLDQLRNQNISKIVPELGLE
ncbi:twitch domain-containing radical SAM protein [Bacteriovorax sp. PP10]|uniref:Twitch domain-containing radical SAM protein n=1 Tax=Bacteriovorax antarcticus TaxID=3088717 RepID=A0ABU5VW92_9BACT|nr:twitch domain-containing radical SAM protein [Bacteriovorax sp. PP10]MEA9357322.1 twitch domain-containing radical SAM protein [Bacteriovorax sp. PP10]